LSEQNESIDFLANLTNVPNALLLIGNKKELVALDFAAKLLCDNGGCGICTDCQSVLENNNPNVVNFISTKTNILISDVKELIAVAESSSQKHKHKVIILNNADSMIDRTSNFLLKAIEEPPMRTVWILTANSQVAILPTIRSRCLVVNLGYKMNLIPTNLVQKELRKNIIENLFNIMSYEIAVIRANKFIVQIINNATAEYENSQKSAISKYNEIIGENQAISSVIKISDTEKKSGINKIVKDKFNDVVNYIFSFWNDILVFKHTNNSEKIINNDYTELITQKASTLSFAQIHTQIDTIISAKKMLTTNTPVGLVAEYLFVNIV